MAWRRPGDKLLSEPMFLVYWCIYASLSLRELKFLQQAPHNLPLQGRYGVLFETSPITILLSPLVIAELYAMSWYIGLRYNNTQLYFYVDMVIAQIINFQFHL